MTTEQKKIPFSGINNDDALNVSADGDYLNLLNARLGISEYGKDLRIENVAGTTAITNNKYPPYGSNQCIGSCIDIENKRLIWAIYNTFNDHGIYAYSFETQEIYAVVYDSQTESGLGFDKNYRIDRNCKVINGVFYWTDNNGDPHKINIDKGIKLNQTDYPTNQTAYTTPILYTTTTVIRRPPYYALDATKNYDSSFINNYTAEEAFQMLYYYDYVDGESSRLSAYSDLLNYNTTDGQTYNSVLCKILFAEYIDDDIQRINICAKNLNTNSISIVKVFDKSIPQDLVLINDHNDGITQLQFIFYNNEIGITLDSSQSTTPFDSVPLKTKTLETAVNRLMMGNNLSGYNLPTETSLTSQLVTVEGGGGSYDGQWGFITLFANLNPPDTQNTYMYPFVYTTTAPQSFYYFPSVRVNPAWNGGTFYPDLVSSVNIADAQFASMTESSFVTNLKVFVYPLVVPPVTVGFPTWQSSYNISYDSFPNSDVTLVEFNPSSSANFLKSGGSYRLSIEFLDRFRRKCASFPINNQNIVPQRTYTQTTFTTSIQWALSNVRALFEIPDWAYYYQILITKNLTTRFFLQGIANAGGYVVKNEDGTFDYSATTFSGGTQYATAFVITPLFSLGLGYTYNEGDLINVYLSDGTTLANIPVKQTDGNYVLFNLTDVGTIDGSFVCAYELFTPYKSSISEPYYETGQVMQVLNPGTVDRRYNVTSGVIVGDTYNIERDLDSTIFIAEAMSPNDRLWQMWNTATGWVNYTLYIGQTRNEHEIRYSNTFIPGSQTNGLSTFEALNYKTVPLGTGSIQKLQLASKTEEQGVIMLSIGSFQTASCYLGEVQVVGASSNAFLAQDAAVIGTINVLKGMFGTTAPETVIEYLGLVFWYDLNNGAIVQYSVNGLEPVSRYKMNSFFQRYARNYLNASPGNLDNINGFHHIPTAINPFTKRLQVTTPGLIYSNYAATLPSYSSVPSYAVNINNYFDIYTELPQTVCFDIIGNRWKESWEFAGEWYDYFDNIMIGWKNGTIYTHETNTTNWNTVYGVQLPMRFCFTANPPLSAVKDIFGVTSEGSVAPDWTVLYTNYPYVSITDLTSTDYNDLEGVFYATFFRDRLTPGTGTADQNLYTGNVVKSQTPMVQMEYHQYSELVYLNFVDILYDISRGQKRIVAK